MFFFSHLSSSGWCVWILRCSNMWRRVHSYNYQAKRRHILEDSLPTQLNNSSPILDVFATWLYVEKRFLLSPSVLWRNVANLNTSSIFRVWDGGGCFLKHLKPQKISKTQSTVMCDFRLIVLFPVYRWSQQDPLKRRHIYNPPPCSAPRSRSLQYIHTENRKDETKKFLEQARFLFHDALWRLVTNPIQYPCGD